MRHRCPCIGPSGSSKASAAGFFNRGSGDRPPLSRCVKYSKLLREQERHSWRPVCTAVSRRRRTASAHEMRLHLTLTPLCAIRHRGAPHNLCRGRLSPSAHPPPAATRVHPPLVNRCIPCASLRQALTVRRDLFTRGGHLSLFALEAERAAAAGASPLPTLSFTASSSSTWAFSSRRHRRRRRHSWMPPPPATPRGVEGSGMRVRRNQLATAQQHGSERGTCASGPASTRLRFFLLLLLLEALLRRRRRQRAGRQLLPGIHVAAASWAQRRSPPAPAPAATSQQPPQPLQQRGQAATLQLVPLPAPEQGGGDEARGNRQRAEGAVGGRRPGGGELRPASALQRAHCSQLLP